MTWAVEGTNDRRSGGPVLDRVVVLGMHRSGTSAITRVVNILGLPLCRSDDLYSAPDNPSGHWESESLYLLNEELLVRAGGNARNPPPQHAVLALADADLTAELRAAFHATHGPRWVWKDPRTCLTWPLWRRAIGPAVVVLVLRDPAATIASLVRRDGVSVRHATALWEHYLRAALTSARFQPTVVVRYEDFETDPKHATRRLAANMRALGVMFEDSIEEAAASFTASPRRSKRLRLTSAQHRLVAIAHDLPSASPALDVTLSPPTPLLARRHAKPRRRVPARRRIRRGLRRARRLGFPCRPVD